MEIASHLNEVDWPSLFATTRETWAPTSRTAISVSTESLAYARSLPVCEQSALNPTNSGSGSEPPYELTLHTGSWHELRLPRPPALRCVGRGSPGQEPRLFLWSQDCL